MTAATSPTTESKAKGSRINAVVRRPSSDNSRFHMSKDAVDRSVMEIAKWSDLKCVKHFAKLRWGSTTRVICPHCNTGCDHYWYPSELRWKCKGCGKKFSVTSGTVFFKHKLSLQDILGAVHLWACGAAGQPALEIRRMLNFGGYNTGFSLVSKLRESLDNGFNIGFVSGVIDMDGAHASGRRASVKRGRPLNYTDPTGENEKPDETRLTQAGRQKAARDRKKADLAAGGVEHPGHGAVFPASRRIAFSLRKHSGTKGRGALMTRVGVAMTESPEDALALAEKFVAIPESILSTDTGKAFSKMGKSFKEHTQVNHSETLVNSDGHHVNFSESFTARQDRSEKGVYLNIEPKFLTEYLVESAFREDHRRMAPGAIADSVLRYALITGNSRDWQGYTHGRHRGFEKLVSGTVPAKPSGPEKGRSPIAGENGRPPR